mmetsp:Transcript_12457/g.22887  ORF Transcript_12457/g.22887 Transcript_12457/m.22887 type:complete len:195 (-) Transcript_12457:56-640(-)
MQASLAGMGQQRALSYTPAAQQQSGMALYQQQAGMAHYQQAMQQQQQPVPPMKQQQVVTYAAAPPVINQGFAQPQLAVQPQAQAVVKMEVGVWQVCEDQQGEFYVHTVSGQQFDQPPAELLQLLQQQPAPAPAPVSQQVLTQPPTAAQPVVTMEVGEWQVCEDQQGEYYVHTPSGQTFDQPPPELLLMLQQLHA